VFGLDTNTLIWIVSHIINVGLLAFILSKILYKPVRNFMAKRSERISSEIQRAASELAKADELKASYEQKLGAVDAERDAILAEAKAVADKASHQLIEEAKAEAAAIRAKANANVALEWERAQAEMKGAIIEVAAAMSAKFIKKALDAETGGRLFDETMAELGDMSWRS
jgi:F-type H+-transporting ATPase subunit b